MPNLHITLGANSLKVDDAATLDFPAPITKTIDDFLTGNATQDALDALADRLKQSNDAYERVISAHEFFTPPFTRRR